MKRYFSSIGGSQNANSSNVASNPNPPIVPELPTPEIEVDSGEFLADPGLRKAICDYVVGDREKVRRAYLQKGPCQPRNHTFPTKIVGKQTRKFIASWFKEYSWLEYSISKDAAYCLPCYLFKPDSGNQGGGDSFVGEDFRSWKKKEKLDLHVGDCNSIHNRCVQACEDLMHQKRHIEVCLTKHSDQSRIDYRSRLIASIHCIRFLLLQGLAFRGHEESNESSNQGNFLELVHFLADHNDEVKRVTFDNAPGNLKMISPIIQKDIINAFAIETTNAIIRDMGDNLFSVLVDEARDVSVKEQMAVVLLFVDDKGCVVERFLGIVHVADTVALSLKMNMEALFSKHGLSISSLRGQGYDGASNMRGQFNGLKTLIMMENSSAYYVHCFAHQLQLALVVVAQSIPKVEKFFYDVSMLTNVVSASCKRKDMLRTKAFEQVSEGISEGEIFSGRGQNQEVSLTRAGGTRWNSHYRALVNLIILFDPIVDVLMAIQKDADVVSQRAQATNLLDAILCFEFVFLLLLMKNILGVSNDLSQALQRKDQDIVSAMDLVKVSKQILQQMRDETWESVWDRAAAFCTKHKIEVPNKEDFFAIPGRIRRNVENVTNLKHYCGLFNEVIDLQLSELNNRFNEVNTELLLCMSCLDPRWEANFQEDSYSSGGLECLDQSEDWLADCLNDSDMHDSPTDINSSGMSDVLIDITEFNDSSSTVAAANNTVQQRTVRTSRNIIFKGRKSYMRTPTKLASSVAYPFTFIKPSGENGDVTLKEINQRIRTPPPSKPKEDDPATYGTSAITGKPVVNKTRIRTEGGKGSITIMRTKG